MEYLIALLLGVFGSLIAWEISLRYRKWCEAIIRSAVRRLPDEQRIVREEEWLAALNDCVGLVSSFSHAAGCWIGAPAVAAGFRKVIPARASLRSKSNVVGLAIKVGMVTNRIAKLLSIIGRMPRIIATFEGLAVGAAGAIITYIVLANFIK